MSDGLSFTDVATLATELVCVLRDNRHYFPVTGIHSQAVKAEFLQYAAEEMGHADNLAKHIVELGGLPDFSLVARG
jgi:bacterioferritin